MKRPSWLFLFGAGLVATSALLYSVHYAVFRDAHHILLWSFTSFAFLPISVLVVTLIISRLLTERERQAKLQKLNMVIGIFFSEVGTQLLAQFTVLDANLDSLRDRLVVNGTWTDERFKAVRNSLRHYAYDVSASPASLAFLLDFLSEKRDFLLRLLENPNLFEHEAFTALLRAVLHLAEELAFRDGFDALPETDIAHLVGDIRRAYVMLVSQWVEYMRYMKNHYPYLFSLAMRTNPFDRSASPVVGS